MITILNVILYLIGVLVSGVILITISNNKGNNKIIMMYALLSWIIPLSMIGYHITKTIKNNIGT